MSIFERVGVRYRTLFKNEFFVSIRLTVFYVFGMALGMDNSVN